MKDNHEYIFNHAHNYIEQRERERDGQDFAVRAIGLLLLAASTIGYIINYVWH